MGGKENIRGFLASLIVSESQLLECDISAVVTSFKPSSV